jgi:ribonuclease HII
MLLQNPDDNKLWVSCDEVARGCFAGPVTAAAVIWQPGPWDHLINDSKKLSAQARIELVDYIKENALDYVVEHVDNVEIDKINILNATMMAMHRCLDQLLVDFDSVLVDGNYFKQYKDKPFKTVIKGDATYVSIAAASILAKETRDEYIKNHLSPQYPEYMWDKNVGYGTKQHIDALLQHGPTPYHRMTFIKNYI